MSRTKPTVLAKTKPNALIGCLGIVLAGRLGLYVDFDGWVLSWSPAFRRLRRRRLLLRPCVDRKKGRLKAGLQTRAFRVSLPERKTEGGTPNGKHPSPSPQLAP